MEVNRGGVVIRVETPAKLNLFLEVLGKRSDGFHEIETVMVAITLYDTLIVSPHAGGRIRLECDWTAGARAHCGGETPPWLGDLPHPSSNIVLRAAEELQREADVKAGASLRLIKRIPSAAGMGGASSDAAAALRALDELWCLRWPVERLAEVGARIGSDVPFFVQENGRFAAAQCRGRGERIERLAGTPPLHVVILKPPVGLSTADVYRGCVVPGEPRCAGGLLAALRRGDRQAVGQHLFNRLQEPAVLLCPTLQRIRQAFRNCDVCGHQMSGSGTSYFAICRHQRHARQVAAQLRGQQLGEVYCASTCIS
ncbi:MAG: 4-(cytidine 5'-diphospho)-2-C-methyl-D-erythritol kinase [Pirellulaceae bacterium]